ncbi:MAG TPA: sensor domain-containing diguanylate cyclase [Candidatus Polarisedimenticolia bacterium]|nr:sensor domain-containing diguanylate cyclase [Candidatus Polarisedimenticolia bacterium]
MNEAPSILREVTLWPLGGIALLSFVLGYFLARMGRGEASRTRGPSQESTAFVDLETFRESQKIKARLELENQTFSEFFQLLTDFTRELDGNMDISLLPRRLLGIIDKIFLPSQILIFITDPVLTDRLILKESKSSSKDALVPREIPFGEGKIGWVAQSRTTMDQEDFVREMRTGGANLDAPGHFRFKVDLCAPMLENNQSLQGVISVGGITRHPKFEKRLLSMIADLGAMSLMNRRLMEGQRRKANSDGLTGLITKRYLQELLGEEIHKAEVETKPVSLFIFDLDHFKKLNDTHGHLTGDLVLKETAEVVRKTVREGDIAARWGGEEFLVILPETPKEGAWLAAEKVRQALAKHVFHDEAGDPIAAVTLSGGVATFPGDGRTQSQLVGAADEALYGAKRSGRNKVMKAEPKFLSEAGAELVFGEGSGAA